MGRDALIAWIDEQLSNLHPIGDERYVIGLIEAYENVKKFLTLDETSV